MLVAYFIMPAPCCVSRAFTRSPHVAAAVIRVGRRSACCFTEKGAWLEELQGFDDLRRSKYSVCVRMSLGQPEAVRMVFLHATGATTNSDSGVTDLAKVAPAMEVGTITVSTQALVPVLSTCSDFPSSKGELNVAVLLGVEWNMLVHYMWL